MDMAKQGYQKFMHGLKAAGAMGTAALFLAFTPVKAFGQNQVPEKNTEISKNVPSRNDDLAYAPSGGRR